jgi:mannose-6-phosphate isomerase-like protein (cupin superfamily)
MQEGYIILLVFVSSRHHGRSSHIGESTFIQHEAVQPLEFDGLKIIDYTAGRDTRSSLAEITVPAGVRHRSSWSNRSDKYYYVVEGNIEFTLNGESKSLSSGDICVVHQAVRFSYVNSGSNDVKLILIHTPSFKSECEVFE